MADWEERLEFGEDEASAEDRSYFEYSVQDCIVCLVDAHSPMFEKAPNGEVLLQFVLRVISKMAKTKIIDSPDDLMGICFYGTRNKRNSNGLDHVFVQSGLQQPTAEFIQRLGKQSSTDDDLRNLVESFGGALDYREKEAEFYKALWVCSTMFSEAADMRKKNTNKRIFLFTFNDEPNKSSDRLKLQIRQKVQDLRDLGIELHLFAVKAPFSRNKFFKDAVIMDEDELDEENDIEAFEGYQQLLSAVRKKQHKKRASLTCKFHITPNLAIGVKLYSLLNKATKSNPIWLDAGTNERVSIETKWICEFSGQILQPHEIRKYYPYSTENVLFTDEELKEIKSISISDQVSASSPGITLIGFKSYESLLPYHNIRPPYFIIPDETTVVGSTLVFRSLLESMLKMKKIALAWMISRYVSMPQMVAICPQQEVIDEQNEVVKYGGFNLVFLPFAEEIRDVEGESSSLIDVDGEKELIIKAKQIISGIRLASDAELRLQNPALQQHFSSLQAIALNEAETEPFVDEVTPNDQFISQFLPLHEEFSKSVYGKDVDCEDPAGLLRTQKVTGEKSTSKKRNLSTKPMKNEPKSRKQSSRKGKEEDI